MLAKLRAVNAGEAGLREEVIMTYHTIIGWTEQSKIIEGRLNECEEEDGEKPFFLCVWVGGEVLGECVGGLMDMEENEKIFKIMLWLN